MKAILVSNELKTLLADNVEQAYTMHERLVQDEPDAGWTVMVPPVSVSETPMYAQYDALEHLYALAAILLQQSKLNPFALALSVAQLDGTHKDITAVTIMRQGRELIDNLHNTVH